MKKILNKIKSNMPLYKKRFLDSLPFLLVFQSILFIFSPTRVNQIGVIVLMIAFIFNQFEGKD